MSEDDRKAELMNLRSAYRHDESKHCATEIEVKKLKQLLDGACISPLDKNDGKLHVCCPMFYKMAMDKVFDREDLKSYEEIKVSTSERFFSEYMRAQQGLLTGVDPVSEFLSVF